MGRVGCGENLVDSSPTDIFQQQHFDVMVNQISVNIGLDVMMDETKFESVAHQM